MQIKKVFRRITRLPFFPIVIAPFVLLAPVLFAGKAWFWGIPALQFIPWWQWAFDTLLSGHWPLWNPLLGMGAPLIANYQSALFYPPNWLHFLFYAFGGLGWLAWGQALLGASHIAWGGSGMALLVRRLGFNKFAQTIGGLAFGLSGFVVARGWFASINSAVVWLPWILLSAYDLAMIKDQAQVGGTDKRHFPWQKVRTILILGVLIGLQLLAGHAQISWYTIMLVVCWVGFWTWHKAASKPEKRFARFREVLQGWVLLAFSAFLGIVIAAVQLLPTAEYLLQSQRAAEVDYEIAMTYSFWPWRFLGFLAPDIFGSPVTGNFSGYATYWEDAVYIGLLPLLLAFGVVLSSLFKSKNKSGRVGLRSATSARPLVVFLLLIIFVSFLFALGKNTPVYPWLYQHVPTFDMFKSPTRFSIWAIFALALLAAIGAENWHRPTGRALYWTRLSVAGAFAVSLGAGLGWVLLKDNPDFHVFFIRATTLAGFWGLGASILSILAPESGLASETSSHRWQLAVILWITADLLVFGWGLNPGIELDFYTRPPANIDEVRDLAADGRIFLLLEDEDDLKYQQYFTFETFDPGKDWYDLRATFLPNLNMLSNIPMINNYDPMVPGRYARWMEAVAEMDVRSRDDLLDLMSISVIEMENPSGDFGVMFKPRHGDVSRAVWVPCARYVSDEQTAWEMVFSGTVDFGVEVVLEELKASSNPDCASRSGSAEIIKEQPNQVNIQTESVSSGWLVLADIWYPGWRAEIDGKTTPILRANYLFRAVAVPEGSHLVRFVYQPFWFYFGLFVSLLTSLGLIVGVMVRSLCRKRLM